MDQFDKAPTKVLSPPALMSAPITQLGVLLEEYGLSGEDEQIILRRVQTADGRTRGFINDQPVSIGALKEVGESLLEVHGQHDGRGFLSAGAHRDMLDEFGGLEKKSAKTAALWRAWRDAEAAFESRRRENETALRERDYLQHVREHLGALAPQPGEESELAEQRAALMAAEKIADDLTAAANALDDGVDVKLSVSARNIERAAARVNASDGSLSKAQDHIANALNEAAEARQAIDRAIS